MRCLESLGSYWQDFGVPLRVPLKGSIGFWGFRGSYKWGYKSPNMELPTVRTTWPLKVGAPCPSTMNPYMVYEP